MRHSVIAGVLGVALFGLAMTGCSSGPARSAAPPSSASAPSTAPTSAPRTARRAKRAVTMAGVRPAHARPATVRPVPGSADATPPPPLRATGTNFVAVARSLTTYRDWLLAHHPDPALAAEIVVRGTTEYQSFVAQLTSLASMRRTLVSIDQRLTFTPASVHGSLVTLRVRETIAEDRVLDREHRVVQTESFPEPNDLILIMTSDGTGRWRIADITQVALDPAIVL